MISFMRKKKLLKKGELFIASLKRKNWVHGRITGNNLRTEQGNRLVLLVQSILRLALRSRRQGEGVLLGSHILLHALEHRAGAVEVGVHVALEKGVISVKSIGSILLGGLGGHGGLPLDAVLLDLLLVVELGIVVAGLAQNVALVPRQVLGVHGRTVVLFLAAGAEVFPAALLLLQVQTSGIGKEEQGDESTGQTEPRDNVELGLGIDVVVQDGGEKGTSLTPGSGHTVSGGTDGGGENLGSDQEGDRVGTELVEERAQEVHGLEGLDVLGAAVVVEVEGRDDKQNEAEHKTNDLHPLATVQLVVDQEGGHVVSAQRDTDIDQVPQPGGHDRAGCGTDHLDELTLEELVAVEENIVGEPATSSCEYAESEVLEGQLQGLGIITSDGSLLLGSGKLLASSLHVVGTVVNKPQSTDGGDCEGNTVGPLNRDGGVRVVTTAVVEAEQENDEDDLVEELTPTLHQEGGSDLAATVQAIFLGGDLSRSDGVLHTAGGSHGVLTTNTDTVDEETPSVTDDPAILSHTPGGSQHNKTEKHDDSILDQTPATANPCPTLVQSHWHG